MQIAFDGPAASGKSTIARETAKKLGFLYVDTGAMYRAVTWMALTLDCDMNSPEAITAVARQYEVTLMEEQQRPEGYKVMINNKDITDLITCEQVNRYVSPVAQISAVRRILVKQQQKMAQTQSVVMAGRDITTVVLPHADLKIYLDASLEERTQRRYREEIAKGAKADLESIRQSLANRDRIDSTRSDSPLTISPDATVIDSTGKTIDEVIAEIIAMVEKL